MSQTTRSSRRLLTAILASGLGLLAWSITGTSADAARQPDPRPKPKPTASPTPSPSPSPTPTPGSSCGFAVVPSPNAGGADNTLSDVSVLSATDAWAVGEYTLDGYGATRTLIQHYDGTAWTIVPSPNRLLGTGRNQINSLLGVTAIAPSDVWAVGYTVSLDDPYRTLTMHWNGAAWSIVNSPNLSFPGAYNTLTEVSATSPDDVWAVGGSALGGGSSRGLLLHFDGAAWSLTPGPPNVESWASSARNGVVALSANSVWAVGDYDAWHYDGTSWTVPAPGAQFANDVDAAGPDSVWAVGSFVANPYSGGVRYPIGHRFTGTGWQQQHAADLRPGAFNGVTVRAPDDVIAVGYSGQFTYALAWRGTGWQPLTTGNANPSPNTNLAIANVLTAVAHAGGTAWTVGYYYTGTRNDTDSGVQRTLIERYTC
jgi:hypothetical protein